MDNEQIEQTLIDAGLIVEVSWYRGEHFKVTSSDHIVSIAEVQALLIGADVKCSRNSYIYSVAVFVN